VTDTPITAAIVGAGYIAQYHVDAVRATPGVSVRAICDLNRGRAERFAEAAGVDAAYSNLGELLEAEKIDVLHVLTPPHLHAGPAEQALRSRVDVLVEKPMAHSVETCRELRRLAEANGCAFGVSHNFLYYEAYEHLVSDLRQGRLGRIDQVDIVWNKELGQLSGGPFGAWMLQAPRNILFEVAPHSFAHCHHLVGHLDSIEAHPFDPVTLPSGFRFFRRWEIMGWAGTTSVRIRFSFIDGYPEHYIHVRGSVASARADFERSTYVVHGHSPHLLDVDRYIDVTSAAKDSVVQATSTLAKFIVSKAGVRKTEGDPFGRSIARAVRAFYDSRGGVLDEGVSPQMGQAAVELAERVATSAQLSAEEPVVEAEIKASAVTKHESTVLVIGGTGFIGRALVRRLVEQGYGVRVLARDPSSASDLAELGVDLVRGDFLNTESVRAALAGIEEVFHLARGSGNTWEEYLKYDVEPTRRVAELCVEQSVRRLYYASSIAIYEAGKAGASITEDTRPVRSLLRANVYARSKAENEAQLLELGKSSGLPVVIFRPGIVLGKGGSPRHWGVAAWPYPSVARLYGDGSNPLPIVLVEDVADAMVKAIDVPGIEGESFNLTSDPCITANEYLDELEKHAHIKLRRVSTSPSRLYGEAMVKWAIKSLAGRELRPSYSDWRGRTFASTFDPTKTRERLGWSPESSRDVLIKRGIHDPVDEFLR
jgi:nucleoside-diphosphate-sugar epimerase/predicted dehydrogenase